MNNSDSKESFNKFKKQKTRKEAIMKDLSSVDLVFASDHEEFFYNDSNLVVESGEPIGFDVENGDEVELVLFNNIHWNPNYDRGY